MKNTYSSPGFLEVFQIASLDQCCVFTWQTTKQKNFIFLNSDQREEQQ